MEILDQKKDKANLRATEGRVAVYSLDKIASSLSLLADAFNKAVALPLILVIFIYQKTISPDHGVLRIFYPYGFCKYHPTCSMYAREVLAKDGIVGMPRIIKRLASCNPASLGGIDLP